MINEAELEAKAEQKANEIVSKLTFIPAERVVGEVSRLLEVVDSVFDDNTIKKREISRLMDSASRFIHSELRKYMDHYFEKGEFWEYDPIKVYHAILGSDEVLNYYGEIPPELRATISVND
ncbi:hypothetical protein ACFLZB_04845 [Nanoarchaeota archaeon]